MIIGMNIKSTIRKVVPRRTVKHLEETFRRNRTAVVHTAYGRPARKLRIIAVTGTNGKTTTCNYINDILKAAGNKTALYTTAVIEVDGTRKQNTTHRTVPHARQLMAFLRLAKKSGVDFVILEITSHALHQHKVLGIPIEVSVMTNISQDHLDYHGTMEAYAQAKARLFNGYTNPKVSILNRDDSHYDYFAFQARGEVIGYVLNNERGTFRVFKDKVSGINESEGAMASLDSVEGMGEVQPPTKDSVGSGDQFPALTVGTPAAKGGKKKKSKSNTNPVMGWNEFRKNMLKTQN